MHEGDMSAGLDDTETAEKSMTCNVRGSAKNGGR